MLKGRKASQPSPVVTHLEYSAHFDLQSSGQKEGGGASGGGGGDRGGGLAMRIWLTPDSDVSRIGGTLEQLSLSMTMMDSRLAPSLTGTPSASM
jgi:hypothetical protein